MSQLVHSGSSYAERGTKLEGGFGLYSCNTRGGGVFHVIRIFEELAPEY